LYLTGGENPNEEKRKQIWLINSSEICRKTLTVCMVGKKRPMKVRARELAISQNWK
jgi:hypothetical protein